MATHMKTPISLVSFNPKPTISSYKISGQGIVILRSGSNFNGQKLQTMHFFYKGLQHNKNRAQKNKMIAITARTFTSEHNYRFPEFNNGEMKLWEPHTHTALYKGSTTLLYRNLKFGNGEQPSDSQKVLVTCTFYNERQEVKGIEDQKITFVIGEKNNELGKGFDRAVREMRVNGRAIFIIYKTLWPTGRWKPKTGFGSKDYIVCDVTLEAILS